MKKLLLIGLFLLQSSLLFAQNYDFAEFNKNKFEEILPVNWRIEKIEKNDYPYGFLENADNNGLGIFLKGPTDVKDKGGLVKESISIWIMPLNYLAQRPPPPGPAHFLAKLIGQNEKFMIYVLPWNDIPSWKTWREDIIKYFELKENL